MLVVFEAGAIIGVLGQAYTFPYVGLVGCSAGVYSLIGCNLSHLIMHYESIDPLIIVISTAALSVQFVSDTVCYFVLYSSITAYSAHISGYIFGLSFGFLCYSQKKEAWRNVLSLLGFGLLAVEITFLVYNYSVWPPKIVESGLRSKQSASCCCSQLFALVNSNFSAVDVTNNYVCLGDYLAPTGIE